MASGIQGNARVAFGHAAGRRLVAVAEPSRVKNGREVTRPAVASDTKRATRRPPLDCRYARLAFAVGDSTHRRRLCRSRRGLGGWGGGRSWRRLRHLVKESLLRRLHIGNVVPHLSEAIGKLGEALPHRSETERHRFEFRLEI